MKRFFEFAGKTGTLLTTFVLVVVILFLVFPNVPIDGELLDEKSGYSLEDAIDALTAYGADGRSTYLWTSLGLDTFFPLIYVTFFAGLIYRFRLNDETWWLAYIPIVGGIWDLMENVQISSMLLAYPEISETQVSWASVFTKVKHWMGSLYLVIGVLLLVIKITRTMAEKVRSRGIGS